MSGVGWEGHTRGPAASSLQMGNCKHTVINPPGKWAGLPPAQETGVAGLGRRQPTGVG